MRVFSSFLPGRLLALALALAAVGGQPAIAQTDRFAVTDDWSALSEIPAGDTLPDAIPGFGRSAVDPNFRLGPGDVLLISVLEDPTLDSEVLVRPDGLISVPLAGTVTAAGSTPEELAATIRRQLAPNFIEPPTVNVALRALAPERAEEQDELMIYVLGQVNSPGQFPVRKPVSILQALALAGGPSTFAALKRIQVRQVTEEGIERVLLVNYEAIEEGSVAPTILLGDGDTIVVPERGLFE